LIQNVIVRKPNTKQDGNLRIIYDTKKQATSSRKNSSRKSSVGGSSRKSNSKKDLFKNARICSKTNEF
jgi:hypothetical protein